MKIAGMPRLVERALIFTLCAGPMVEPATPAKTPAPQTQERFAVRSLEVLVDAIVTDRKNRLVADLTADEFEIYEDGVPQQLRGFLLVHNEQNSPTGEPAAAESDLNLRFRVPQGEPNRVALVFDNNSLTAASRIYARHAAEEYVERISNSSLVAVFGSDDRLFLVQPFTGDRKLLKKAIEQVTKANSLKFPSTSAAVRRVLQNATERYPGQTQVEAERGPVVGQVANENTGQAANFLIDNVNAIELRTLESFERLEQQVQGKSTMLSLLAIVEGLRPLPGRKAAVFLSEGFALPSYLYSDYQTVTASANRSNVAIYTVDAAGLRVESESQRVTSGLNALARQTEQAGEGRTLVRGGESSLGRRESLIRSDREGLLEDLASSTGGISIRDTNDLRSALATIEVDLSRYYLLTYTPSNAVFDGGYRRIEVKVKRPGLSVRARDGYIALHQQGNLPVFEFEQPLLSAILDTDRPSDFDFQVSAFHFPNPSAGSTLHVTALIPALQITYRKMEEISDDDPGRDMLAELTVLAAALDERGAIVEKASQQTGLRSSVAQVEAMAGKSYQFQKKLDLPPGRYALAVAARDAQSGRVGQRRLAIEVPSAEPGAPRLGSLVLIRSLRKASEAELNGSSPFLYQNILLTPALEKACSIARDQQMILYLMAAAPPAASLSANFEFARSGQVVARTPADLPPADSQGRAAFVAPFPLSGFEPGDYTVRVTLTGGQGTASMETQVKIEP